jgi:uncharacterized phiE125 gp8 family phage protein
MTWIERWRYTRAELQGRARRTRAPTLSPLTPAEIVLHLRLAPGSETGPEKELLDRLQAAMVGHLERYASIAVMDQEWRLTLNCWPPPGVALELPYPPLVEITDISMPDPGFDPADFLITASDVLPGILYPAEGHFWPGGAGRQDIAIALRCGYEDPKDVPPSIKQALLTAIATGYENRESLSQYNLTPILELGWENLIMPYREAGFA